MSENGGVVHGWSTTVNLDHTDIIQSLDTVCNDVVMVTSVSVTVTSVIVMVTGVVFMVTSAVVKITSVVVIVTR